ncbi:hypothetical protein EBR57_00650 [bacterium]|nr:hypothetical protein [bacterium]
MTNSDGRAMQSADDRDTVFIAPRRRDKHDQFVSILKTILPYIGSDEGKIILTQVMIALKVEGVIGTEMTPKTEKMVNVISESIMKQPGKKIEALKFANRLLG